MPPCLQYRFSFFISLYLNINFSMQLPDISICSIFSLQCSYRNHCVHLLSKRYSLNNYQLICNFPGFFYYNAPDLYGLVNFSCVLWMSKMKKNSIILSHSTIHKILQNLVCKNFFENMYQTLYILLCTISPLQLSVHISC